ncbi:permease [Patescibacteria group bacterium]|nr:permease [Patescibacteria group bacterium]MBU1896029.1 permease [Patescibacteria group bacterium]
MNIFYPIELFADWFTYTILKIVPETPLGEVVNFFILDIFKIFILLIIITHLMSLLRYYLPIEKFKVFLTSRKFYGADYFLSTCFGALTPFCSCSSIPLFIGFLQSGLPLGVTFAFLITSPLINEIAISLFIGLFGWKVTLAYLGAGIGIGMLGGFIIGKLKMEKYVINLTKDQGKKCCCKKGKPKFNQVFFIISREAWGIVGKVGLYIFVGVAIGAIIHGFVPADFFEDYLQKAGLIAVPLAVILAVPLYSNASGVIPIIQALVAKGVSLGTGLAFMMAVVGLSFPEAMMLKRVLKMPLLLSFFGIVTLGIILIGYLFNFLF